MYNCFIIESGQEDKDQQQNIQNDLIFFDEKATNNKMDGELRFIYCL